MKKLLFVALGIVALISGGVLWHALLNPIISYQNTIVVNRPIDEVFATFIDTTCFKYWMPDLKSVSEDTTIPKLTSRTYVLNNKGIDFTMHETIVKMEKPYLYESDLLTDPVNNHVIVRFVSTSTGTTIYAENELKGTNLLWHLIFTLRKKQMREEQQQIYLNLKKYLEKTTPLST